MKNEICVEQHAFQHGLECDYQKGNAEHPLAKMRSSAWEKFLQMGLPTRQTEVFRYVKLRNLYNKQYVAASEPVEGSVDFDIIEPYILPESAESTLVFVNGHFQPNLSRLQAVPKNIIIAPLSGSMRSYGALLTNQWSRISKEESDPFALLNLALQEEGIFIYLPPNIRVSVPLQLLYVVDGQGENLLTSPRMQCFVGRSSEIEIVSTHAAISNARSCINQVAEVTIDENAHFKYIQVNKYESKETYHFDALRATLKKNSVLNVINATEGSDTTRNDYRVVLNGENGEASLNGVGMLKGNREAHNHVLIDHRAPNCLSRQLYKGVLKDLAHSSFEGKIFVCPEAQKTNAFQLNNNLLLSDRANAESKPNLEIFADDVKASHGATVGQLDQESLFYMKSRGFSDSMAKNMLVYGFCQEVIEKISIPSLRMKLSHSARHYLQEE